MALADAAGKIKKLAQGDAQRRLELSGLAT